MIGARLIKIADIRTSLRTGALPINAVTLVCVVFPNLLEGIMIGLALAPWSGHHGGRRSGPGAPRSILTGINKYHRRFADHVRPLVQDLADTQNPDTLFVACVDSRVNPDLITSRGPGDLLTLRNIGNVVRHDGEDASIDSALSFAVNAQLEMVNVAVQLAKLDHHPLAGSAITSRRLQATGLFYDIATARVVLVKREGIELLDPAHAAGRIPAAAPAG